MSDKTKKSGAKFTWQESDIEFVTDEPTKNQSPTANFVEKEGSGYVVKSSKGKNLSRKYKSKGEATKRLQQIEYFKTHK